MGGLFLPVTLAGLGAVALWLHVRYPSLRPPSLVRAVIRVVLSFVALAFLPRALSLVLTYAPPSRLRLCLELALLIPVMTYWLLSLIWFFARIFQDLLGGPRGGHPVRSGAR